MNACDIMDPWVELKRHRVEAIIAFLRALRNISVVAELGIPLTIFVVIKQ